MVRQTEEDLALVECFANGACAITPSCRLRKALGEALAAFLAVLDRYTLADLLAEGAAPDLAFLLGLPAPGVIAPPTVEATVPVPPARGR